MTEVPIAALRKLLPELEEGALLAGRYRIGRVLGSGGMGAVFAAEHVELREPVAIKVLLPSATGESSSDAQARFEREAWAASRIKSEYVARVSDVGRLANGSPFLVMEYLDGLDLAEFLLRHGSLELTQAVELVLQACEALAEAHALGICHRDLKPANLFVVRRSDGLDAIKLLDFGISRLPHASLGGTREPRLTSASATLGTPLYMAPEQMRSSRRADERSDIWALGVILYELSTGQPPYDADSLADLAVKIATEPPQPMRTLRTAVPAGLERVVARCLEKSAADRYPSAAELARALVPFGPPRAAVHAERAERIERAAQDRNPSLRSTRPLPIDVAPSGSHARMRGLDSTPRESAKLRPRLVIALALLAVAIGFGWLQLRAQSPAAVSGDAPPMVRPSESVPAEREIIPAAPAPAPPEAASRPVPTSAAPPAEPVARPNEKRRRVAKPAARVDRPSATQPSKDSELDSLGGRL